MDSMSMSDSQEREETRDDERVHERWLKLLEWLKSEHSMAVGEGGLLVECRRSKDAGIGLYALETCPPSTTLFTIPAKAMINVKTLSSLYSPDVCKTLKNTLISLHLYLHAPSRDREPHDPTFGPYISTIPRDFGAHPLIWLSTPEQAAYHKALLAVLPPIVCSSLNRIKTRLMEEWNAVRACLVASRKQIMARLEYLQKSRFSVATPSALQTYLWAWLSVNTRCIYYQLHADQSDPDNLTLCPILDFANHAPTRTHVFPVLPSSIFPPGGSTRAPRSKIKFLGGDYMFLSSSQYSTQKDEELFLKYGAHANRTLFVEYGFVNLWNHGDCLSGSFFGEVDVQDVLEDMFTRRGAVGEWMKGVLEGEGYWGDWTMHSSPTPAHPSYRLMTALRLYHLLPISVSHPPADFDAAIEMWRLVITGKRDIISVANEQAWRATLLQICEDVTQRAKDGIRRLEAVDGSVLPTERPGWFGWMLGNIRLLWLEEQEVAEAVAASVRAGDDF